MFEIDNFAAGLIPNAAWSNFRSVAAVDWKNLRVHPQGFLTHRHAHTLLHSGEYATQIFVYRTLIFAVVDGTLKWGRIGSSGDGITFNAFNPVCQLDPTEYYHFQAVQTGAQEFIVLSNGTGDPHLIGVGVGGPVVVDLKDVFQEQRPQAPTQKTFYIQDPGHPYDFNTDDSNAGGNVETNYVQLLFQAVRTTEEQEGVPWSVDFVEPDVNLPALAPTVAVSEAIPALGIEGDTSFTVSFVTGSLPVSDEMGVDTLEGTDVDQYLAINTATDPPSLKTQIHTAVYTLKAGEIEALVVKPGIQSGPSFNIYFEYDLNNENSWKRLKSTTLDFDVGNTRVKLPYNIRTLGRLAAGTVIKFRLRTSQGSVRLPQPQSVVLAAESAFLIATATDEDTLDTDDRERYTEVSFRLNLFTPTIADYIDVYRSRRREPGAPYAGGYQLIARIPHEDGYQFAVKFPVSDQFMPHNWIDEIPEKGEVVSWQYVEADAHRLYAAVPNDNRLYLSYFDGIANRHFLNFTDFIDLPTGGEAITGIKFLDDNFLAVYTPHRIILVSTDPAPELMRVNGVYSQGERDEAIGCVAPLSLVESNGYHFFLSPNKRIYRFGGRRPTWVSAPVQPLLETLTAPGFRDGSIDLSKAVGVVYKGSYYLSFPSIDEETTDDHLLTFRGKPLVWKTDKYLGYPSESDNPIFVLNWKGEPLVWQGRDLEWKRQQFPPNTTLIYDFDRNKWYKDDFGIEGYSKDETDRLFGIIDGDIYTLYDSPYILDMDWEWHSNYLMMPPRTQIFNVCIKTQIPVDMTVTVKTEQGSQTRELSSRDANDYWGQYVGFNLLGRTARIILSGKGSIVIDRITINERARRR